MSQLEKLIEQASVSERATSLSREKVIEAKDIILKGPPNNNSDLFLLLSAMNYINAALKSKEYGDIIYYGLLKPKVSILFKHILDQRDLFEIDFYIDFQAQCAYIEIEGLQFSFHNIAIDGKLKEFIDSPSNIPKAWKGVRLQKIAGELFDYSTKKEA